MTECSITYIDVAISPLGKDTTSVFILLHTTALTILNLPYFSGEVGSNLAFGLFTSCCVQKTAG